LFCLATQDVRGFVVGGYSEFGNSDGDIGHLVFFDILICFSKAFRIQFPTFFEINIL